MCLSFSLFKYIAPSTFQIKRNNIKIIFSITHFQLGNKNIKLQSIREIERK